MAVGRVGSLVEPLGDRHRPLRAEAELPARLLLQGRGRERRGRAAGDCFRVPTFVTTGLSSRSAAAWTLGRLARRRRRAAAPSIRRARPANVARPRRSRGCAASVQYSRAVNASISRSRSTTSRTATDWTRPADSPARTLRRDQRAEGVADEPVDDPPRLLGVDEVRIDLARVGERVADRALGDLVECHPLGLRRTGRSRPRRRARRSPRPRGRGRWRG